MTLAQGKRYKSIERIKQCLLLMARRSIQFQTISVGGIFYAALEEAGKSTYMHRLGAIVLNKGKVTGKGHNQIKTHSGLRKDYGYYSQHAEARAILDSNGCGDTMVIARRGRDGKVTMSKPCDKCMRLLKDKGFKKIYYTDWNGQVEMMRIK